METYNKQYYINNKQEIDDKHKQYVKKNNEKIRIYNMLYSLNNKLKQTVRQTSIDKYQIYYDEQDQQYKSKLYHESKTELIK
jgi:hypothetical protein